MNETITRRSFLNLKNTSTDRIVHIDPEWPTPEMAKLELDFLESEPFIFKLPIPKEKPKKLNTKTSLNKLSSNNWDLRKAAHLLRRISSGSNYDEIKHFSDIGLNVLSGLSSIREISCLLSQPLFSIRNDIEKILPAKTEFGYVISISIPASIDCFIESEYAGIAYSVLEKNNIGIIERIIR